MAFSSANAGITSSYILEVRGCNGDAIAFRFAQEMRKDGDGRLSLDHTLREIELHQ